MQPLGLAFNARIVRDDQTVRGDAEFVVMSIAYKWCLELRYPRFFVETQWSELKPGAKAEYN